MRTLLKNLDWLTDGVNFSIPGDGGPDCREFTDDSRRFAEGGIVGLFALALIAYVSRNCHLPDIDSLKVIKDNPLRRFLLALLCIVFGMEIAFKLSSKTVIYLLNPCHVITVAQIYLLTAAPSKMAAGVFRFHLAFMNGGVIALAFPVLNTLFLPLEIEAFFIQHVLILIVPLYLLNMGGAYSLERWNHLSWPVASYGGFLIYHLVILPPIAAVNLSQTLCPAITDPFCGPNYRLWAVIHQGIFMPLLVRIYLATASLLINFPKDEDINSKKGPEIDNTDSKEQVTNNNNCSNNKCS